MNIGIIGLPQTGKKTVFELLAGPGSAAGGGDTGKTLRGVADVLDTRFNRLAGLYKPKKLSRARLDILLPPKMGDHAVSQGGIFRDLIEVEAFCYVVRAFEDEAVYHISGSVDPVRDIDYVNTEFVLHDLLFIEKRVERLDKELQKNKNEASEKDRELLLKLREHLEKEMPLRTLTLDANEKKALANYPLLSSREMIVVLNVGDEDLGSTARIEELNKRYAGVRLSCVQICASLESEIASLETEAERTEFMDEMGIRDTALHLLTEKCIESLGLISFFTAAPNELRQWFVHRNATAVEAAGKIHTDLARGFIRAEVIQCADLIELGSEEKVKGAGRLGVKGRDYIVEDGDILFIRFSV
jgi:GTP-binding protein YchF